MKRLMIFCLASLTAIACFAQDDDWQKRVRESQENARKEYDAFQQQAIQDYNDFRRRANEEYARFMEQPWTAFENQPAEEIPMLPKPPKPIVADPDVKPLAEQIPFVEKPLPEEPVEQPKPIEPLKPKVEPEAPKTVLKFFGTDVVFHLDKLPPVKLKDATEKSVSNLWKQLSTSVYDNLIAECLQNRSALNLCDWGYVMLTEQVADRFCGGHTNEAVVLHMYLLTQSGYQMRLGRYNDKLCVLVGSKEKIYHYGYFVVDGINYYLFDKSLGGKSLYIFNHAFPKEKMLSLVMTQPKLTVVKTKPRTLTSERFPKAKATITLNKNVIDFFNSCPLSSEWILYSKASLTDQAKSSLYPALREAIKGKSEKEAANILINFVQTGFEYATDQKQFGYERPLYPDESLYYPYCDCEDRSILFACLVRELMGLDVVLLDYPEHISTAVRFTEDVEGDYFMLGGKKYVACDPTFIGARIGMSMPNMKKYRPNVLRF